MKGLIGIIKGTKTKRCELNMWTHLQDLVLLLHVFSGEPQLHRLGHRATCPYITALVAKTPSSQFLPKTSPYITAGPLLPKRSPTCLLTPILSHQELISLFDSPCPKSLFQLHWQNVQFLDLGWIPRSPRSPSHSCFTIVSTSQS